MFGFITRLFRSKAIAEVSHKPQTAQTTKQNVFATGNFESVSLYDILLTFSSNRKSAEVTISVKGRRALIRVSEGKLDTGLYHAWMGKDAVLATFAHIEDDPAAQFLVKPYRPQTPPSANRAELKHILKEVAHMLDEKRSNPQIVAWTIS